MVRTHIHEQAAEYEIFLLEHWLRAPGLRIKARDVYEWIQIFLRHLLEPDEAASVSKPSVAPMLEDTIQSAIWLSCGERSCCNDHWLWRVLPGWCHALSLPGLDAKLSCLLYFFPFAFSPPSPDLVFFFFFFGKSLAATSHLYFGSTSQSLHRARFLPAHSWFFLIRSWQTG